MIFTKNQLKNKAFCIFETFRINHKEYNFTYNYKLNMLLEFCDYIDNLDDWELAGILATSNILNVRNFRKTIKKGADYWLDSLIKTICL